MRVVFGSHECQRKTLRLAFFRPVTDARCVATWWEDITPLPLLPRRLARGLEVVTAPANVLAGRLIFGRVLRMAADQAERAQAIASGEDG